MTTDEDEEKNIVKRDKKTEDDLDKNGEECSKSCGVVGYRRRPMFLKELQARKRRRQISEAQYTIRLRYVANGRTRLTST